MRSTLLRAGAAAAVLLTAAPALALDPAIFQTYTMDAETSANGSSVSASGDANADVNVNNNGMSDDAGNDAKTMDDGMDAAASAGANAEILADLGCAGNALRDREEALMTAFDAYHEDMAYHMTQRSAAFRTAWDVEDSLDRRRAINDAWAAVRPGGKDAAARLRQARRDAWADFRSAIGECGPNASINENAGMSIDLRF